MNNDTPMESSSTSSDNTNLISANTGKVTVALHPLVILNISDHYTRIKAQGSALHAYGALLGQQSGRHLEIFNSFEMIYSVSDGIDMDYFRSKEEQFRQVFTDLDFLGWYTVGTSVPSESDVKIHKQMVTVNENSILMKLNPMSISSNLPVTIYESVIDIVEHQSRMTFNQVTYTLVTEEAERIGVDHVGRVKTTGISEKSQVSEYMQVQRSAIKMLQDRIKYILQYVKAVKTGELPVNQDIMREVSSLCQRLPVMNTSGFKKDFLEQYCDVSLMSYLATITQGCNMANELVLKFNLAFERQGGSRRPRGMLF